ncbi:hypothetical protein Tco_0546880 [Tanacetum coccineum]
MKTKRKLDPKSNPHTGDCNVVPLDVADCVLDVNSNAPAKRQRANGSGFISPLLIDVGPSGVQNVAHVGEPALPTTVMPMEIDESSGDATHVVRVDNYSSRCPCSDLSYLYLLLGIAFSDRTRRHPTTTAGTSSQHAAPSGPPLEYKDLGNCAHICQHCGALFWFEERLKSTPRGSLCPVDGEPPRFLQLYIYDTDNEVDNRLTHFGGDNNVLRRDIVEGLIDLLDSHNVLVQLFRTACEKLQDTHVPNFKVRLYNVIGAREYELPRRHVRRHSI